VAEAAADVRALESESAALAADLEQLALAGITAGAAADDARSRQSESAARLKAARAELARRQRALADATVEGSPDGEEAGRARLEAPGLPGLAEAAFDRAVMTELATAPG
jgi:hypothetical protein